MLNQKIEKLLNNEGGNYIFPFFWQHGESEEVLREYMRVIHESNIGAVCVESRPHPDFCGPGWWHDMDIILDEARNRKMKVWILDDSHFPTGYANGAMAGQPDELCRQSLVCRHFTVKDGEKLTLDKETLDHPAPFEKTMVEQYVLSGPMRTFDDDRLLSVSAWNVATGEVLDLKDQIHDGQLDWAAPAGDWTVYLLHLSRNYGYHRDYINMMDARSCRVLIDAVYEPHYAHYREDFGTTIAGFFSDEPELGNGHLYEVNDPYGGDHDYPWSAEVEECLKNSLGDDYALRLPLLWEKRAGAGKTARLHDTCSADKETAVSEYAVEETSGSEYAVEETAANELADEETARVRCAYMDAVTKLVQKDFSEQLGDWCRAHGVQYIGHLIEDDNHHSRTGSSLGHYFRGLAGQDMAGIDDIGGQVFPQGEDINYSLNTFAHRNGEFYHYLLGKLADSAAAIEPRKQGRSMCEIFGNYGWAEGVRLEKYLIDHFLVRGINHFVPHAFSPKEYPDPDCPPHFYAHGNNPQYRHFGCLMAYTNRLCELLNDGRHIAPVAVLYHAEGDWTGKYMTADKIGHRLADAQIDYDILPSDVFADRAYYRTEIGKGTLTVNTQQYRALILPTMQFIPAEVAEAAGELQAAGIPVYVIDSLPAGICRGQAKIPQIETISLDDLVNTLDSCSVRDVRLPPADSRIRCRHYVHTDGSEILFIVNEGTKTYEGTLALKDTVKDDKILYIYDAWDNKILYIYDAWDNKISSIGHCEELYEDRKDNCKKNEVEVPISLEPLHSLTFVLDAAADPEDLKRAALTTQNPEEYHRTERKEIPFTSPWLRDCCRSIDYPAFADTKEIQLPDHLAVEAPKFSGYVRYRNHFAARKNDHIYLEITDAHEGVETFVNGKSLGIQIVPPFRYDLTPVLSDGDNELTIEVATTLERENSGIPDVTSQVKEPTSLSGITGQATLYYMGSDTIWGQTPIDTLTH